MLKEVATFNVFDRSRMRRSTVSKIVSGVSFSFFTEEEVKKMSVVKIVTPQKWDLLQQPIAGGLYDLAMGAIDRDQK
jgi:DNA-directed RNA polymerase I subunit RPA1